MKESSVFGVYSPVKDHAKWGNACTYYRVEVPLRAMRDEMEAAIFIDDGQWGPEEISIPFMVSSDIILWYGSSGDGPEHVIKEMARMKPGPNNEGELRYPPSTIYDLDDNLEYVHPFNITYGHYGIRNIDGTRLKPGDSISVELPSGGEMPIWVDKQSRGARNELFDIERNISLVKQIHEMSQKVDGCTFTTQKLCDWYRDNYGVKHTYAYPNSVIPEDYPHADFMPHDEIRILWQGGSSHAPDWAPLREAIATVAKKYPQTKWIFWGARDNWAEGDIPDEQRICKPWVQYKAYKPFRALLNADINLCPLADNEFNQYKSAIKWYEGAMYNEATLAANVGEFKEIADGESGMLYDNPDEFVEKLSALIENVELRKKIGEGGNKWVLDNRHYRKTAHGLMDFYKEIRERKKAQYKDLVEVVGNGRDSIVS